MPRQARIDALGALHHIVIRGIERRSIFKDDKDREDFLERLSGLLEETATPCYAWALMTNHVHLLLRTGIVPIATIMRRLLTGYAVRFNRRHGRYGHLFQNRYKSILCEEDGYLRQLVAYIHLNPVRAGIVAGVAALKTFPYTGHSALMGKRIRSWQDTEYILALFGRSVSEARRNLQRHVSKWAAKGPCPELTGGGLIRSAGGWRAVKEAHRDGTRLAGDERILGSGRFVEKTLVVAKGTPFVFLHSCDDSGWKGTKCSRRWRQITSQGRSYHWACDAKRSRIILLLKLLSSSFPPYRFGTSTDEFTDTDPIR